MRPPDAPDPPAAAATAPTSAANLLLISPSPATKSHHNPLPPKSPASATLLDRVSWSSDEEDAMDEAPDTSPREAVVVLRHIDPGSSGLRVHGSSAQVTSPLPVGSLRAGCLRAGSGTSSPLLQRRDKAGEDACLESGSDGWTEVCRSKGVMGRGLAGKEVRPPRTEQDQARRDAYLRKMRGRCFHCLSHEHFAADCREPLRCWRCFRNGHLAALCHLPARKPVPPSTSDNRSRDVIPSSRARLRSYADVVAPSRGSRYHSTSLARARPFVYAPPRPPAEQDFLSVLLTASPMQMDVLWRADPMRAEASVLPLHQEEILLCCPTPLCSALVEWSDVLIVSGGAPEVVCKEHFDPMYYEASLSPVSLSSHSVSKELQQGENPDKQSSPDLACCLDTSATRLALEMPPPNASKISSGFSAKRMTRAFGEPCIIEKAGVIETCVDAIDPWEEAQPPKVADFISKISNPVPLSLLGNPAPSTPEVWRHSGRLEKKNKSCNVLIAKRAEQRLMEAFGELPDGKEEKISQEETAKKKMKSYIEMYKQPLTTKAIEAIRALAGLDGKAQIDLASLGSTTAELSTLGQDVNT